MECILRKSLIFLFLLFSQLSWSQESAQAPCVKIYEDPNEAFEIRTSLIDAAQEEIVMSYYAFMLDARPTYILNQLKEASLRGVKVKIILDAYNSKLVPEIVRYLKEHGVEIRTFNPLNILKPGQMDRRLHDKYIVVDNKYLLVGGRNLKEGYFIPLKMKANEAFYDLDALFFGSLAEEAKQYFDERWNSDLVRDFELPKVEDKIYSLYKEGIDKNSFELKTFIPTHEFSADELELSACENAKFIANNPHMKKSDRALEDLHVEEINKAQVSIDFQSPYVVLTKKFKKAVKAALKRGVKIRFITNSLRSADVPLTQAAYLNLRPKLIKWGAEVYEFMEDQTMHTKMSIYDGKRVIIGSYNLDPRSARINSENVVLVEDSSAVAPMQAYFESTLDLSAKIDRKGRPEGYDKRHPGASFGRRLLTTLFRFTLAPILRSKL